jgi:uncharacterized protein YbjT (DUF2867 family)
MNPSAPILVTGATGTVGSIVLRKLTARRLPVRALVRDPQRAFKLLGEGIDYVQGDLLDPGSLVAPLAGVAAAFLATSANEQMARQECNFLEAARASGLPRLVKLSAYGARVGAGLPLFGWHAQSEATLRDTGIPATVLQPAMFMSNFLRDADSIRQGRLRSVLEDGRINYVDPADVADLAVAALANPAHEGQTWEFGGPLPMNIDNVAECFTRVLGRPVQHERVDVAGMAPMLRDAGWPTWYDGVMSMISVGARSGRLQVNDAVIRRVLGRPGHDFDHWLMAHCDLFC